MYLRNIVFGDSSNQATLIKKSVSSYLIGGQNPITKNGKINTRTPLRYVTLREQCLCFVTVKREQTNLRTLKMEGASLD